MRCIFSECLNESTLPVSPGAQPGQGILLQERASEGFFKPRSPHNRFLSAASSLIDDLVSVAFPGDCAVCTEPLLRATRTPICDACRARVQPQTAMLCARCGEALSIDLESAQFASRFHPEGILCHACRLAPPMFEQAVAASAYEDELREMIHLLKYERVRSAATLLGAHLATAILPLRTKAAAELLVVPVPLFPSKERQRGYNQSELIADSAIAELHHLAHGWRLKRTRALTRRRDTKSQFELTPRGRRRNLEGAFAANKALIPAGCEVLLIDDIYTTGATARECARALRRAGAEKVWVATVARAQVPRIAIHQVAMWDAASEPAPQGFG